MNKASVLRGSTLLVILALLLMGACDEETTVTQPPVHNSLIESMELTPNMDSGSPLAVSLEGTRLAVAFTSTFGGSGDIFRLVLQDSDGDGIFDIYPLADFYPNENDSSFSYTVSLSEQFTYIGAYEVVTEGDSGEDTTVVSYPGNIYLSGPRQLFFDQHSQRIFYSMSYQGNSEIASTQVFTDGLGGHVFDVVNRADEPLEPISTGAGRAPIWDFWHTKADTETDSLQPTDWAFTGGYYVTVSPPVNGQQWMVYADTLFLSYDQDGDRVAGEDPVGEIKVVMGGQSDGQPGYIFEDDDNDGLEDSADLEVIAMMTPVGELDEGSYPWRVRNYRADYDDDEDGVMDEDFYFDVNEDNDSTNVRGFWVPRFGEDPIDGIDNDEDGLVDEDPETGQLDDDYDGLINEDPRELPQDNDGDGNFDEDQEEVFIDNDGDGWLDEDPSEQVDNDDDGVLNEDPSETPIDDDGDGLFDEDSSEQIDNDNDGLLNEDPLDDIDNDNDGLFDEDPQEVQIDNDNDGLFDEDWYLDKDDDGDGLFGEDPVDDIDNDEDGAVDEDPITGQVDNDRDDRLNEDPTETEIDNDADGLFSEDPSEQIDNDEDGLLNEDPSEQVDNDNDGLLNEDSRDLIIDDDQDGRFDEDGLHPDDPGTFGGDMNGDGFPGIMGFDDDQDGLIDLEDMQVRYGSLRVARQDEYDPVRDDDEDGITDEDTNVYQNGLWARKITADGLPDDSFAPILLTKDRGRQPFFNPVGTQDGASDRLELLYVSSGDIYRLTLESPAGTDTLYVVEDSALNLTNSFVQESYAAYSDDGEWIVYCSSVSGSSDIWIMTSNGSSQTQITNEPGQELMPRFTPGANQILYEAWLAPDGNRRMMITVGSLFD